MATEELLPPVDSEVKYTPVDTSLTTMFKFRQFVNDKYSLSLGEEYSELHRWSCEHLKEFWSAVWEFTHVISSQPYMQVINENVSMDRIPEWFVGSCLNFAENLLRFDDENHLAIISTGESGLERQMTYRELRQEVAKCASALREIGVKVGDRVCAYIPNCIEAIVVMLASASIGAIWSSTSPDFGTTGVLDRFAQIKPKVLVSVNAVVYNGKTYDHMEKLKSVATGLPTLKSVIVINFTAQDPATTLPTATSNSDITWSHYTDLLSSAPDRPLKFEQLRFNHPLYILYSSGTTGLPKCIVHSAGGTLLQHLKEHVIHGDITRDDVFFQYTTTGWMMWNWLVSALATGCTIVLYDGSPFKPHEWILWDLCDKYKFTKFGTSAKYLQSMEEMKVYPCEKYKLESLGEIYSTGSPLTPQSFDFVYSKIKPGGKLLLSSITGGTDIVSLFAGHNHTLPVRKGEIVAPTLGMAIEAWGEDGKKVEPGHSGDLVCVKPFPCMPVFFWNDEEGHSKYKDAYFSKFSGVWYHGDYIWLNPKTMGVVMLGRSDGTLKPAGVRFGSAEIYNIIERHFSSDVQDSLCVGQRRHEDLDERVVLFLKMRAGVEFSEALVQKIRGQIRKELSPRHVPAFILEVTDIPYTINGKKVEVAVKKIVSGQTVVPSATLANPESLKLYENIQVLK